MIPVHQLPIYFPLLATPAIDVSLMAVCQYGNPRQYLAQVHEVIAPAIGAPAALVRYRTVAAIAEK
jgi:hypothetical protein